MRHFDYIKWQMLLRWDPDQPSKLECNAIFLMPIKGMSNFFNVSSSIIWSFDKKAQTSPQIMLMAKIWQQLKGGYRFPTNLCQLKVSKSVEKLKTCHALFVMLLSIYLWPWQFFKCVNNKHGSNTNKHLGTFSSVIIEYFVWFHISARGRNK